MRRSGYVLLMMLASACNGGNSTPTSPSSSPSAAPTPPPAASRSPSAHAPEEHRVKRAGHGQHHLSADFRCDRLDQRQVQDSHRQFRKLQGRRLAGRRRRSQLHVRFSEQLRKRLPPYPDQSQNVRLYRVERITAGDSTPVTVAPDDTLCVNNVQDSLVWVRTICVEACALRHQRWRHDAGGTSTTNGPPPLLEVEIVTGGDGPCCSERLENPTSIPVTAGTEVVAHVEMPFGSATSQSFTLNTSMRPG